MKKYFYTMLHVLFLLLINPGTAYAVTQVLSEEIIYNADKTEKAGKKVYLYEENRLVEIKTIDEDSFMNISYKYFYLEGALSSVQEFNNDVRIKYSVFYYDKNRNITHKVDFNSDKEPTCIFEYVLNKDGAVAEIKEFLPDKTYLGGRKYVYVKGRLEAEEHVDSNGEIMLIKDFIYKGPVIVQVEYFLKKRKIRVIERKYTSFDGTVSQLGLPAAFFDLR